MFEVTYFFTGNAGTLELPQTSQSVWLSSNLGRNSHSDFIFENLGKNGRKKHFSRKKILRNFSIPHFVSI